MKNLTNVLVLVLVLAERLKKKMLLLNFIKHILTIYLFLIEKNLLLSIKEQNLTTDHICIELKMKTTKRFKEDF